jgi:ABC-2 type transport system permease protein
MTGAILARGSVELKVFFRDRATVGFIFALPVILLVLLCAIFGDQVAASTAKDVTVGQVYVASMIAGGIAATSFQYLGILIAQERGDGLLRRLYGTPMPPVAYFAGKVIQVAVCALAETVLLLGVGVAFYHVRLPGQPEQWLTFAWVFVLGTAACAIAGIAVSSVPRTTASASPIISLSFTVLQFISGIYVPLNDVPPWLRDIASVFPLKWMAQGLRSVFLPAQAQSLEPAGTWEHGRIALVLLLWIAGGLVICARTFRWQNSN